MVIETAPGRRRRSITAPARWCAIPTAGKYRRTRLFVLTLGYSRKSVRLLVFRSSTRIWAELHEKAFRRLGGVTARGGARQPARGRARPRTSTIPRSIRCTATC